MRETTKAKYDTFIKAYLVNGQNGAQAAIQAGYAETSAHVTANKMLRIPYIEETLKQKQQEISKAACEAFSISLEQRLQWLGQIVTTGLRETNDIQGNLKAENLQASTSAIKELNAMLGTTDNESDAQSLNINFSVSQAVAEVKVTNATT